MFGVLLGLWFSAPAFAEDPPPEVEKGSTKEVYVVKKGDTLRSIADAHAFLVDDLARWNGLTNADKIEIDQKLVMWVAPKVAAAPAPAPVAAPVAPEPVAKAPKERKESEGVGGFVGLQLGPAIAFNPLTPAFLPRLEAGVELPVWDRRLRWFVAGTWSRPVTEGTASDPRVPDETWSYRMEQTEITAATGLTVRVVGIGKVVPEFSLGPSVWFHRSVVDGEAGGAAFGESTESYARVGFYGSGGLALSLGPGELNFQVAFGASGFGGVVAGEATATALTPLVGYRVVF